MSIIEHVISGGTFSLSSIIINVTLIMINLYCIMLQRYNQIRINQILKKGEGREQRQKDLVLKKIENEKELTEYLNHKIVDKNEELNISLEEFLQVATLEQLKKYKESLEYIKNLSSQELETTLTEREFPLEKGKTLKLELKKTIEN